MRIGALKALILSLLLPSLAGAQSRQVQRENPAWRARPKLEILASAAMGHVFRFEDRGYGNQFNLGVGVEVPVWRKLRLGAEVNKTFGLSPRPARCGAILSAPDQPLPCVGTAREGMSEATAGSLTVAYYFGDGRVQPYLVSGLSLLSATEYTSVSSVRDGVVEFQESSRSSTGIGPALGFGLHASIHRRFSVRPEIRFYDGTALSSVNVSQWHISLGIAYGW
jgi:hypothetical protein